MLIGQQGHNHQRRKNPASVELQELTLLKQTQIERVILLWVVPPVNFKDPIITWEAKEKDSRVGGCQALRDNFMGSGWLAIDQ